MMSPSCCCDCCSIWSLQSSYVPQPSMFQDLGHFRWMRPLLWSQAHVFKSRQEASSCFVLLKFSCWCLQLIIESIFCSLYEQSAWSSSYHFVWNQEKACFCICHCLQDFGQVSFSSLRLSWMHYLLSLILYLLMF